MKLYKVAVSSIKQLPRQHRIALASTSLLVMAALMWQPSQQTYQTPKFQRAERVEIELPHEKVEVLSEQNSEPLGADLDPEDPEFSAPKDALEQKLEQVTDVAHKHKITSGETLGSIFSQYALPISDMYRLIKVNKSIQNLRVGQTIEWSVNDDGQVKEFNIQRSKKITDSYTLVNKGYQFKQVEENGVIKPVFLTGRITGSFYNSALAAGLTPNQIQTLVQVLQWRFDFGREVRKGDRFAVSVEREFIDGKAVTKGELKALYYLSDNREIFVMRHSDDQFYDTDGNSLNRALRRIPLAKRYRISSSFNPTRKHPVTRRISPHNGTDFATPIGTPVLAAGDGVVVKASKHRLAGNYVVIKHGREYMTRYLHLHKLLVKVGDRVTMGQRIALSGNTGRSTGPHLHFELIKKNRPVNAMKVPLPQADPVPSNARSKYKQLANSERQKLLAVMPG
ncbi:murein DD-endopeptidase MepM [Photobacterium lipolyticum]|uniref:Murein DD-endopeptidase MepM n=1 Tax=Photobacterium lipolyticum TaxID=266810 RepID=A0A2T3N4T8_9GAMM|nr:murein DD-endopeptidase MepM [Photobacterium lipolyticum]PSW07472.1 murein DD-endopeptidase MepM [Photobacterium lipolyticum]